MTISFKINYLPKENERLFVVGMPAELGSGAEQNAVPMTYAEDGNWELEVETSCEKTKYNYLVKNGENVVRREAQNCHSISFLTKSDITLHDSWETADCDRVFMSKTFTEKIYGRTFSKHNHTQYKSTLLFRVKAFRLPSDAGVMLLGNRPELGNWNNRVAPKMSLGEDGYWFVSLNAEKLQFPLEYKYAVCDLQTDEILFWETGDNHFLDWIETSEKLYVRTDETFRKNDLAPWKAAGVSVPVFSLRTKDGFGVGEFPDLKKMIDWAVATSQKIIQILPINDTTITKGKSDSYPYNAISVFALHPMYANIEKIGKIKNLELAASYEKEKKSLNQKSFVDYAEVNRLKWKYIRYLYEINMPSLHKSVDYQAFFAKNESWLLPYAVFSYLRDKYKTANFRQWKKLSVYDEAEARKMARQGTAEYDGIAVYFFIQYHLHKQLLEVKNYAREKHVVLKGDIPIGVSPNSVEAWTDARSFHTDMSAGAPPDDFSEIGQNWGFPTYNWDEMAKNSYSWWKSRLAKMSDYFDAFRIDHILGFFRIWEIPTESVWGLLGHFNPAKPLTVNEIESFGLKFDESRFLNPYITKNCLQELFGGDADKIAEEFLLGKNGIFSFKEQFSSQQKTLDFCLSNANYKKRKDVQEKLLGLHAEVLFLRDPKDENRFHPRISMTKSHTFSALSDDEKQKLERLYVDFYYYRHNEYWKQQALKKLPALLDVTDMMVCGEDLGMIPQTVPEVMSQLQILSLEIERMPKSINTEFSDLRRIPYLSVCTPATHDMSPIRLWWEEDEQKTQRYFNNILHFAGDAPKTASSFVCEHVLRDHLWSSAMWTIFQLQDWISMNDSLRAEHYADERINEPSNPQHFWCYRIHFQIETLLKSHLFNSKIKELISFSGRNLDF